MQTFIITGASSFIGVALSKFLLTQNHFIFAVVRKSSKHINNIPINKNLKIIYYEDLSDIRSIQEYINSADIFIHLAWKGTSHEGRHNHTLQEKNIEYSLEAINIAHEIGCKLFVETGSQAEYGFVQTLITEETECHPENEYGRAKLKFGELASSKCKSLSMKYIHLRIMSIYGSTDHLWTLVMSSIRKMLNNEKVELSSCEQLWNFVCVEDAVKQIYLLCQNALNTESFNSEIYHIGSNDTRKLRSFVEEMYILTQSRSILEFGAYTPANIVSLNPSMEKTAKATGGFIAEHVFADIIRIIINNYKNGIYD